MTEFERLLAALSLEAPALGPEEILRLQRALNERLRLHDPGKADQLGTLLSQLSVSQPFGGGAFSFGATQPPEFTFQASPDKRSSPEKKREFNTPPATSAKATVERPVKQTCCDDRGPRGMSLDTQPPLKFEIGSKSPSSSHAAKKRHSAAKSAAKHLGHIFDAVWEDAPPQPPAKPPRGGGEQQQQEQQEPPPPLKFNVGTAPPPPPPPPGGPSLPSRRTTSQPSQQQQQPSQQRRTLRPSFVAPPDARAAAAAATTTKENDPPLEEMQIPRVAATKKTLQFCLGTSSSSSSDNPAAAKERSGPKIRAPPKKPSNLRGDLHQGGGGVPGGGQHHHQHHHQHQKKPPWEQPPQKPAPWDAHYERGKELYDRGDYAGSWSAYADAVATAPPGWPRMAKAVGNRGACALMLGRHRDALADCRDATRRDPSLYKAHNRAGRLELATGDLERAARSFEAARATAAKVVPADDDALAARALADSGLVDARRVEDALERARAALKRATELFAAARNASRGGASTATRRRRDSLETAARAECDRSRRAADEALSRSPRCAYAAFLKASAYAQVQQWRDVESVCADFAVVAGANARAHCARDVAATLCQLDGSDGHFRRHFGDGAGDPADDSSSSEGSSLFEKNQDDDDDDDEHNGGPRGQGQRQRRRPRCSRKNKDPSAANAPANNGTSIPYFAEDTLAELYARSLRRREKADGPTTTTAAGDKETEADEALRAAADCDVARPECRDRCRSQLQRAAKLRRAKDRADSAYNRGHYRAAVAMYRDALRIDGCDCDAVKANVHCNLAAAALVLDRPSDALEHCTRALELRPLYARARLRRARARARLGQTTEALHDYDVYLKQPVEHLDGPDSFDSVAKERRKLDAEQRHRDSTSSSTSSNNSGGAQPKGGASSHRAYANYQQRRNSSSASASASASGGGGAPGAPGASSKRQVARGVSSTHYSVLGLTADAQPLDVKRAYARLALKYHPDRNASPDATAAMARINEAYECLKDPSLRASYDTTNGLRRRRAWPRS